MTLPAHRRLFVGLVALLCTAAVPGAAQVAPPTSATNAGAAAAPAPAGPAIVPQPAPPPPPAASTPAEQAAAARQEAIAAALKKAKEARELLRRQLAAGAASPKALADRAVDLIRSIRQQTAGQDQIAGAEAAQLVADVALTMLRDERPADAAAGQQSIEAETTVQNSVAQVLAEVSTAAGPERLANLFDLDRPAVEPSRSISPY